MFEIKQKLATLLAQLNEGLVERDEAMKLALLSLLAGENILLVGPPGTAKSLISRQVAKALKDDGKEGASHFEYLLTKFSTPEEIFGPLSISKLKEDRFERNTAGYLPSVQVAFLDEIFKASSSILNALLTILNERIYHNGAVVQKVPLRSLIAASNELPTGQEELGALYDRFLLRSFVNYVSEDNLHRLFTVGNGEQLEQLNQLTLGELVELDNKIASVKIPESIQNAVLDIFRKHKELFKEDRREGVSDRRIVKVIRLLKVSALTNDRDEIDLSDLMLLRHCLWSHHDNFEKTCTIIYQILKSNSRSVPIQNEFYLSKMNAISLRSNKNIIPELSGAGTENDPIIISTADELFMLTTSEIGKQGYFFKQSANIDISNVWFTIDFQGHYDGHGYTLQGRKKDEALFENIIDGSTIKNVKLSGCSLAKKVRNSKIQGCEIDQHMILESVLQCEILDCIVTGSLVVKELSTCSILRCKILAPSLGDNLPKLGGLVQKSKIEDCEFIFFLYDFKSREFVGYMANELINSSISRCWIEGRIGGKSGFRGSFSNMAWTDPFSFISVGLSKTCHCIEISCCAIGKIHTNILCHLHGFSKNNNGSEKLTNNISIDQTDLCDRVDDANGKDGKTIPSGVFKRPYFKHRLGWDFNNVWEWDDLTDNPRLKSAGVGADNNWIGEQANDAEKTDLLVQQMNANLWV